MRYKRLRKDSDYRLSVAALSGGVRPCTQAALIEDDELAEACNVIWKRGSLVTRPALQADEEQVMYGLNGVQNVATNSLIKMFESICAHPFEVDGELCTVVISAANYDRTYNVSEQQIMVVTLDGKIHSTYNTLGDYAVTDMVAVPCDKGGCPFLLYRRNEVWRPNSETMYMEQIPDEEMYAPLVMMNGKTRIANANDSNPKRLVNGVMYEGFNSLTRRYRAGFTAGSDGGWGEYLYMPTTLLPSPVRVEGYTEWGDFDVTVTPEEKTTFTLHDGTTEHTYEVKLEHENGLVRIIPPLPVSTISNNVIVTAVSSEAPRGLYNPTIAAWFGGANNRLGGTRLFMTGFEQDKARVVWSDTDNPLYFPENNYMIVGDPSVRITALDKQDDMLVIFKENELYYTTYEQGGVDEEAVIAGESVDVTVWQAYFPVRQLSPYIGCDCPDTIATCHDRLVWTNRDGKVYTLASTAEYSERTVREIGGKIRPYLLENTTIAQRKAASAADYDGCYWLFIGKQAYVFDYTSAAFLYVTGYTSSNKSSSDRLAWYIHRFDGLPDGARQRIVSDGQDRAVIFSTQHFEKPNVKYVRAIYTFADADKDRYAEFRSGNGNISGVTVTEHPIEATFTTKAFSFGDIAAYKRIKALFLEAKTDKATVECIADGQDAPCRSFSGETFETHMLLPCIKRCRTMAVRVTSTSPLCVRGIRVQYTPFGCVR